MIFKVKQPFLNKIHKLEILTKQPPRQIANDNKRAIYMMTKLSNNVKHKRGIYIETNIHNFINYMLENKTEKN